MITLLLVALALFGLLLLVISLDLPESGIGAYFRELTKELGIVFLAVFSVSLLYESVLFRKHAVHFLRALRGEIVQGEGLTAACGTLGIIAIFTRRDEFELLHPIVERMDQLRSPSTFRVIARTLFLIMNRTEKMRSALISGATIEFCIFDYTAGSSEIARNFDVEESDLSSVISIFKKHIAEWVVVHQPTGTVRLRTHRYAMLDSCLFLKSPTDRYCVWDWSFGRDLASKRIVLVDPDKALGLNLAQRYDYIWDNATPIFEYSAGQVFANKFETAQQNSR
jgi:hypothetical protein